MQEPWLTIHFYPLRIESGHRRSGAGLRRAAPAQSLAADYSGAPRGPWATRPTPPDRQMTRRGPPRALPVRVRALHHSRRRGGRRTWLRTAVEELLGGARRPRPPRLGRAGG